MQLTLKIKDQPKHGLLRIDSHDILATVAYADGTSLYTPYGHFKVYETYDNIILQIKRGEMAKKEAEKDENIFVAPPMHHSY